MSKLHVIYFHGLGSSSKTDKVGMLRKQGFDVSAPDIPMDPEEAEKYLIDFIKKHSKDAIAKGATKIVFVGTSLGGYWAARMGEKFDAAQVLVNPAMNPEIQLQHFKGKYTDFASGTEKTLHPDVVKKFNLFPTKGDEGNRKYIIAKHDAVVKPHKPPKGSDVTHVDSADHSGTEFWSTVHDHLKDMASNKKA